MRTRTVYWLGVSRAWLRAALVVFAILVAGLTLVSRVDAAWVSIGTPGGATACTLNPSGSITWDGTKVWAAWNDGLQTAQVAYRDGLGWTTIASPGGSGGTRNTMPSLAWDGARLWVAYTDDLYDVQVKYWDGSTWVGITSPANNGTILPLQTLEWNGTNLYVAYQDESRAIQLKSWNGTTWNAFATSPGSTTSVNSYPAPSWDGTKLWVAYNDQNNDVVQRYWNGSAWSAITSPFMNAAINTVPDTQWNGQYIFAASNDEAYDVQVAWWDGAAWNRITSPGTGAPCNNYTYPVLEWSGTRMYASFTDTNEALQVARWEGPYDPRTLGQYRSDGATAIPTGSWTSDGVTTNVTLKFSVSSMYSGQTLTPWVEVRPNSVAFSAACGASVAGVTFAGPAVSAPTGGVLYGASINVTGLTSGTSYKWRACIADQSSYVSNWVVMGGSPDFGVDNVVPTTPTLVSPGAGASIIDSTPDLVATYVDTSPGSTGRVRFRITSDAACTTIVAAGSSAAGLASGTDATWTSSATLADGTYYWCAQNEDGAGNLSAWSSSRSFTLVAAPSLVYLTGFEHGVASSISGGGIFDQVTGAPSIEAASQRSGAYAWRVAPSASATWARVNIPASSTCVVRAAISVSSLPTATTGLARCFASNLYSAQIEIQPSGQLTALFRDAGDIPQGTVTGPTLAAGATYHLIEMRVDGSASSTIDWRVNGVDQPQSNWVSGGMSLQMFDLGATRSTTTTLTFDDVAVSQASADYPIGDGKVRAYTINGAGTHAPGAGAFINDGGGAIDATSPGRLADLPMSGLTQYVSQTSNDGGGYLEFTFADTTETVQANGVRGLVSYHSAATQANAGTTQIVGNAGTTVVYSGDMSETSLFHRGAMVPVPSAGWSPGEINALKARVGFSLDATPDPYWDALLVEADFPTATANVAPAVPVHVSPADGSSTADTTPTLTATFSDPDAGSGTVSFEICSAAMTAGQTCVAAGGTLLASGTSTSVTSGTGATWTPATALANATVYWHARSSDGTLTSAWSNSWQLRIGTPTITISVDAATLNVGLLSSGVDATATSTFTVTTDSAGGYQLSARDESDTWGADTAGGTIVDWTGTSAAPTAWTAGASGGMGVTVLSVTGAGTKDAKWGTGTTATDFANNRYAGLKATTDTTIHARPSYAAASDTITVAWRLNVDATQAAGSYGATTSWTVVATP